MFREMEKRKEKSELELLKKENEELRKELEIAELRAENERLKRRILETKYPYNPCGITKLSDFTRNFGTYSDSNITLCSECFKTSLDNQTTQELFDGKIFKKDSTTKDTI